MKTKRGADVMQDDIIGYEGVFLVYHPASGHCYKELVTGGRRWDDGDITWHFPAAQRGDLRQVMPGAWVRESQPEPGQYRIHLAQHCEPFECTDWEVMVTERELRGEPAPATEYGPGSVLILSSGCTIHVVAGTGAFPTRDKHYEKQPFVGLKFMLKRQGEFE